MASLMEALGFKSEEEVMEALASACSKTFVNSAFNKTSELTRQEKLSLFFMGGRLPSSGGVFLAMMLEKETVSEAYEEAVDEDLFNEEDYQNLAGFVMASLHGNEEE